MYDPIQRTMQERAGVMEVQEIQGDSPILVGRLALPALDWVIDAAASRLIGNPAHGGKWTAEAF